MHSVKAASAVGTSSVKVSRDLRASSCSDGSETRSSLELATIRSCLLSVLVQALISIVADETAFPARTSGTLRIKLFAFFSYHFA